jgi:hypothetical protein
MFDDRDGGSDNGDPLNGIICCHSCHGAVNHGLVTVLETLKLI